MSDQQEYEEIGRVVVEHKASVQRLEAIRSSLKRLHDSIQRTAKALSRLLENFEGSMLFDGQMREDLMNLPDLKTLQSLLVDAQEEYTKLARLNEQRKNFGI